MAKRNSPGSPGAERFTMTVLEMLDQGTAVREVNLRTVARRVGCAHTNAYNYFASLEELLWWSLREALEQMVRGADAGAGQPTGTADPLLRYIDFALEHPEWYRLVWLVPLNGPPPPEVLAYLPIPGQMLGEWLGGYLAERGAVPQEADVQEGARILHRYIHGELAIRTTGRLSEPAAQFRRSLVNTTARLFQQLFAVPWPDQTNTEKENEG